MNPGQPISRPLGLTLLAMANIVVGVFFAIVALMTLVLLTNGADSTGTLLTSFVAGLVLSLGAIVSAFGYLRLSASRGKTLGTVFGLLVIAYVAHGLILSGTANIVYIVMALIGFGNTSLVNTLYKDVFSEE
tara:strand:+ start:1406 stop:1801 length:396 start_codon:yes stop_codon:yes gene_type:complete